MEQNIWRRQSQTPASKSKQRQNAPTTGLLTLIDCRVVKVAYDKTSIKCQLSPIDSKMSHIENIWFPFEIEQNEFAAAFGDLASFDKLLEKPIVSFAYRSPNITTGKATIKKSESPNLIEKTVTENASLSELILGFSNANENLQKVIKANESPNTAIKLSDNKIKINTNDPKTFMEVTDKGLTIGGPVNYQSLPNEHSFGMLLQFQNPLLGIIPSTVVTPIPQYGINMPIEQIKIAMTLFALGLNFIK